MSTSELRAAVSQVSASISDQLDARLLAERAVSQLQRDATALAVEERRQEYLLAKLDILQQRKEALQQRQDGASPPVRQALARFVAQTDGELEALLGEMGAGPAKHLAPPADISTTANGNGRRRSLPAAG